MALKTRRADAHSHEDLRWCVSTNFLSLCFYPTQCAWSSLCAVAFSVYTCTSARAIAYVYVGNLVCRRDPHCMCMSDMYQGAYLYTSIPGLARSGSVRYCQYDLSVFASVYEVTRRCGLVFACLYVRVRGMDQTRSHIIMVLRRDPRTAGARSLASSLSGWVGGYPCFMRVGAHTRLSITSCRT